MTEFVRLEVQDGIGTVRLDRPPMNALSLQFDRELLEIAAEATELEARVEELRAHLAQRMAKWQVPERFAFVDEIPKTSVGKLDKKRIRASHSEGELEVINALES